MTFQVKYNLVFSMIISSWLKYNIAKYFSLRMLHQRILEIIPLVFIPLKVKSEIVSHLVVSDFLRPHQAPFPWDSPGKNAGVVYKPYLRQSFPPETELRSPALRVDSLLPEPEKLIYSLRDM